MKKQQSKKNKSPKRPPANEVTDSQNKAPDNSGTSTQQSFFQAKPSIDFSGPDLSGSWNTCGEKVCLKWSDEKSQFEGQWGVHTLRFGVEGTEIHRPHLGSMELMFGGSLSGPNMIQWGNGQVWTRS